MPTMDPEKKKKVGIACVAASFAIATVLLVFFMVRSLRGEKEPEAGQVENQYSEVPDANIDETTTSLMQKYNLANGGRANDDYWNSLAAKDEAEVVRQPQEPDAGGDLMAEMMSSKPQSKPAVRDYGSIDGGSSRQTVVVERKTSPATREIRSEPVVEAVPEPVPVPDPEPEPEPQLVRKSSSVKSFDDDWGYAGSTDSAISSFDDESEYVSSDTYAPVKCMFLREEKLRSGQKVTVRILEDMVVDGFLVAQNSHLSATCTITSRLELTISSIEIKGKIFPMNYEAYDSDGARGIYCPDITEVSRSAKRQGLASLGSAFGSVGRAASNVVGTGVNLVQTAQGERTVTVPSGYTFYLMKKLNN